MTQKEPPSILDILPDNERQLANNILRDFHVTELEVVNLIKLAGLRPDLLDQALAKLKPRM